MPACHFDAWNCLMRLRLIWWTLLLIQLMPLAAGGAARSAWTPGPPMPAGGAILILMAIFLFGNWWRSQRYKRGWVAHAVTARAYCFGNLPLLGGLASFAAWGFARDIDGPLGLVTLGPAAVALLLFLASYPTGRPLTPRPPAFTRGGP